MKAIEVIATISAIIGILGGLVDLLGKKVLGKQILNRTTFWVLTYIVTLGLGLIIGSISARRYVDIPSDVVGGGLNRTSALERTIDFLKGKTSKLNEQIAEYENRLKIPPKGRIILFDHINYNGHRCYLTTEDQVSDLSLYGFGNSVSSIKVEGDIRARIYSGIDYTGTSLAIESDTPSLMENAWNDRTLSIDVKSKGK